MLISIDANQQLVIRIVLHLGSGMEPLALALESLPLMETALMFYAQSLGMFTMHNLVGACPQEIWPSAQEIKYGMELLVCVLVEHLNWMDGARVALTAIFGTQQFSYVFTILFQPQTAIAPKSGMGLGVFAQKATLQINMVFALLIVPLMNNNI